MATMDEVYRGYQRGKQWWQTTLWVRATVWVWVTPPVETPPTWVVRNPHMWASARCSPLAAFTPPPSTDPTTSPWRP
ncbi:hypothetical protein SUGI_0434150 [Cryptomeria japonica]|nr:hypothetical protein SUGI_0434150 [Cryptomeria japonica]